MEDRIILRPKMTCPNCGTLLFCSHDLYCIRMTQKLGTGVYAIDLIDEEKGLSFPCVKCRKIYDIADANITLTERPYGK